MTAKVEVVSGGSKGIGLAISKALLEKGFQVLSVVRTERKSIVNSKFSELRLDLSAADSSAPLISFLNNEAIKKS
ncbi:SDR family NAD(P)-dependent oxidoreductase [Idiomarina seosinensis]|uniref:hypothetical protein n=1 Tax=Idiomarina seosinensis TaxID=281739 RepID=UPI00384C427A